MNTDTYTPHTHEYRHIHTHTCVRAHKCKHHMWHNAVTVNIAIYRKYTYVGIFWKDMLRSWNPWHFLLIITTCGCTTLTSHGATITDCDATSTSNYARCMVHGDGAITIQMTHSSLPICFLPWPSDHHCSLSPPEVSHGMWSSQRTILPSRP